MTEFIAWPDDLAPESAASVTGDKMGRLAELSRVGLKVPRGFTVTAQAYAHQFAATGLDTFVDEQLSLITDSGDRDQLTAVADTISKKVEQTSVEPGLAAAVVDAYADLSFRCRQVNQPVAVRSSAIGEDGTQTSFAGVFATYLGISGATHVLSAVQRCWASLFAARALSYRLEHDRSHRDMPMAVGIVELVPARVSGVAFSIHPVSRKPDRIVIEATWGWCEAVVQGVVTPDHIEVDKADRRVLSYDLADKQIVSAFDYAKGEVVETDMPVRFRKARALDEEEIGAIVDTVCRIEEHYGHPVDVEWVIDQARSSGEQIFVVQARPVTGLSDDPASQQAAPQWDPGAYAAKYAFGGQL